eukprot:CAMPEP_0173387568 /NCGR_PEP_ID=MMETSP1356-20130122/10054_1 /TAXON_ID=77927 ORGANISM="Hemiselmis virescens, Strain PCC157" /NCGR_SAMPLE_ID=MMETSP1356 /ASSEMBLY_ACC=CAM_ASM_000847 /LENGTH=76 /DNA_ID=CAMNT_0014344223 /DNA_START=74 /DNA_END=304 /DNA_ORIENTATION=-
MSLLRILEEGEGGDTKRHASMPLPPRDTFSLLGILKEGEVAEATLRVPALLRADPVPRAPAGHALGFGDDDALALD